MANQLNHVAMLKDMFEKVTLQKNANAIPLYYDKNFELMTNQKKYNYNEFLKLQTAILESPIQFKIRYQDETFVEQDNKVAGRVFITSAKPNEASREIEVILIAIYKQDKLHRLWELTYPDWSRMKNFEDATKK